MSGREMTGVVLDLIGCGLMMWSMVLLVQNWSAFWHLVNNPSGPLWWLIWTYVGAGICFRWSDKLEKP